MFRLFLIAALCLFAVRAPAKVRAEAGDARAAFERGVALAEAKRWADAARAFEGSLAAEERPATLYNLLLAYDELSAPLDVARISQRFLAVSDPVRHHSEREHALAMQAQAFAALGRLRLLVAPATAELRVDGGPPVMADDRTLLLMVGFHRVHVQAKGHLPSALELTIHAGDTLEREVILAAVPAGAPVQPSPPHPTGAPSSVEPKRNKAFADKLALTALGVAGAGYLAAWATEGWALHQASSLRHRSPTEEGFLSASDRYARTRSAVAALTWSAAGLGVASATALALLGHRPSKAWAIVAASVGAALIGSGAAVWARKPDTLGSSRLEAPQRELGMLLVASGAPFASLALSHALAVHAAVDPATGSAQLIWQRTMESL